MAVLLTVTSLPSAEQKLTCKPSVYGGSLTNEPTALPFRIEQVKAIRNKQGRVSGSRQARSPLQSFSANLYIKGRHGPARLISAQETKP
jgi:hypothetical protein